MVLHYRGPRPKIAQLLEAFESFEFGVRVTTVDVGPNEFYATGRWTDIVHLKDEADKLSLELLLLSIHPDEMVGAHITQRPKILERFFPERHGDEGTYVGGDFSIDYTRCVVSVKDQPVTLSHRQYIIVSEFAKHPQIPQSIEHINDIAWNGVASRNSVVKQIEHLRKKFVQIDPGFEYISTVHGRGYKFNLLLELDTEH